MLDRVLDELSQGFIKYLGLVGLYKGFDVLCAFDRRFLQGFSQ